MFRHPARASSAALAASIALALEGEGWVGVLDAGADARIALPLEGEGWVGVLDAGADARPVGLAPPPLPLPAGDGIFEAEKSLIPATLRPPG
jgi:hypothetical protein